MLAHMTPAVREKKSGRLSIRCPDSVLEETDAIAIEEGRSFTDQVIHALRQYNAAFRTKQKKDTKK